MNNKQGKPKKNTMKTAGRLLKYVTSTYKKEFIFVII